MENSTQSESKPVLSGKIFFKEFALRLFCDPSAVSLLISNLAVIIFAVKDGWQPGTLLAIYLAQSIIIGVFNVFKILSLQNFSTEGFKIGGKSVLPTRQTQIRTALGFAAIYGFFHVGYGVFVFSGSLVGGIEWVNVVSSAAYFFLHHLFSFFYNRAEREKPKNIGTVMFFPFIRILPMHLTIIFGGFISIAFGFNTLVVILFLVLKTFADILMHTIEHFPWENFAKDLSSRYLVRKLKQ